MMERNTHNRRHSFLRAIVTIQHFFSILFDTYLKKDPVDIATLKIIVKLNTHTYTSIFKKFCSGILLGCSVGLFTTVSWAATKKKSAFILPFCTSLLISHLEVRSKGGLWDFYNFVPCYQFTVFCWNHSFSLPFQKKQLIWE